MKLTLQRANPSGRLKECKISPARENPSSYKRTRFWTGLLTVLLAIVSMSGITAQILPGGGGMGGTTSAAATPGQDSTIFSGPITGNFNPDPFTSEDYIYTLPVTNLAEYFWQVEGAIRVNGNSPSQYQNGRIPFTQDLKVRIEWDSLGLGYDTIGIGIIRVLKKTIKGGEIVFEPQNEAMARWDWPWDWGTVSPCVLKVNNHSGTPHVYQMGTNDDGNTTVCPGSTGLYSGSLQTNDDHTWEIKYNTANGGWYKQWWTSHPSIWHNGNAYTNAYAKMQIDWLTLVPFAQYEPQQGDKQLDGVGGLLSNAIFNNSQYHNTGGGSEIVSAQITLRTNNPSDIECSFTSSKTKVITVHYINQLPVINNFTLSDYNTNCSENNGIVYADIDATPNVIGYQWQITNPSSDRAHFYYYQNATVQNVHGNNNLRHMVVNVQSVTTGVTSVNVRVRAKRINCGVEVYGPWVQRTITINQSIPATASFNQPPTGIGCKMEGTQFNYIVDINSAPPGVTYELTLQNGATLASTPTPTGNPTHYEFNLASVQPSGTVTIGYFTSKRNYCNYSTWTNSVTLPVIVTFPAPPTKPATPTFAGKPCYAGQPTNERTVSVPAMPSGTEYNWHLSGSGHYFVDPGQPQQQPQHVNNYNHPSITVKLGSSAPLQVWVEYVGCGGQSPTSDVLNVSIDQSAQTPTILPISATQCKQNKPIVYCVDTPQPGATFTWEFTDPAGNSFPNINVLDASTDGSQSCVTVTFSSSPYPPAIKAIARAQTCSPMPTPSAPYTQNITWIDGCLPQRLSGEDAGQPQVEATVKVYPNPASANVQVSWTETFDKPIVRLYNSLGQLVSETRDIMNSGSTTFNLQSLAAGIYHVHVTDGKHMGSATIVKND